MILFEFEGFCVLAFMLVGVFFKIFGNACEGLFDVFILFRAHIIGTLDPVFISEYLNLFSRNSFGSNVDLVGNQKDVGLRSVMIFDFSRPKVN